MLIKLRPIENMLMTLSRILIFLSLYCGICNARNFKYASKMSLDEFRHYRDGFAGGTVGTLFMHYPAQIFSCDFPVSYARFQTNWQDLYVNDTFYRASWGASLGHDDYFGFISKELFDTWSSCYQNFVTRYCMFLVDNTEDDVENNRIRMCKHMYYLKTWPENIQRVNYMVREVKPYINFHMQEHITSSGALRRVFDIRGLYPLGFEYLFNWNFLGYASTPEKAYSNLNQKIGFFVAHGASPWDYATFTLLADSWAMKFVEIFHAVLWTSVSNTRGLLTHELTNAYKDFEHIQLHYLTHMCTKLLTSGARSKSSGVNEIRDIFDINMCPNPCKQRDVCSSRLHTSGSDCKPIGLGKQDFTCECTAGYAWNQQSLSCDESFDCNVDCSPEGTRFCTFVPAMELSAAETANDGLVSREGHLRCECYPEFEGERCQRPRDACNTGADGKLSGNEMCRTDSGGSCNASVGTSYYLCSCPQDYRYQKSVREDNCLVKKTACDSVICANNGACYSSTDGKNFECECTPGFEGKLCERPIAYQWTYWGDWSTCDSLCGQGWQSSHRICWDRRLGMPDTRSRCKGNNETLRICHKHCLTEIQASHYMAIGLLVELLFRMILCIFGCFLIAKILFDFLFREVDYVFVRYLRTVLLDLVRRAVGAQQT